MELSYISSVSSGIEQHTSSDSWATVIAHQNQVVIRRLSNSVTYADVEKLLQETTLNVHTSATRVDDEPLAITLSFDHEYLATAAAAIIEHRGALMFSTELSGAASVDAVPTDVSAGPTEAINQLSSDDEWLEASVSEDNISTRRISVAPSEMRSTNSESANSGSHTLSSTEDNTESSGIVVTPLPVAPFSKARRILLPLDSDRPLLTVSMRADINFFTQSTKSRIAKLSIPNDTDPCRVVDAVMLGDYALIGYNGKTSQVAILKHNKKDGKGTLIGLPQLAHNLPAQKTSRHHRFTGAITCIAGKSENAESIKFFTGGSDKEIKTWTLATGSRTRATHKKVISLQTTPHAFAHRSNLLWVGSSTRLYTVDLNHPSALVTARVSNGIHNILLHNQAPTVRILEVDHIDYQVQIFDDRKKSGFGRPPDILFGTRSGVPNRRHSRGDTNLSLYAKGFPDGTVKVWDYRNVKKPVIAQSFQRTVKVTHTVFANPSTLLCYSDKELLSIDLNKAPAS